MSKLKVNLNILMIDEMEERLKIVKTWKTAALQWSKGAMRDVLRMPFDDPLRNRGESWKERIPDLSDIVNLKRLQKWFAEDYSKNVICPKHTPRPPKLQQKKTFSEPVPTSTSPTTTACVKIQSFARRRYARNSTNKIRCQREQALRDQVCHHSARLIQQWYRKKGEMNRNMDLVRADQKALKEARFGRRIDQGVNKAAQAFKRNVIIKQAQRDSQKSDLSVGCLAKAIHNRRAASVILIQSFARSRHSVMIARSVPQKEQSALCDDHLLEGILLQEQQDVIQNEQLSREYIVGLEQRVLKKRSFRFDLQKQAAFKEKIQNQLAAHFLIDWVITHVRRRRRGFRKLQPAS
eukprot:TRINITY_DN14077_c0_g1_i1.p1 TRINITY_DN14077_c0_g1~~TRINITY_DN14077_c0_g1_i1.p1  ORF type:complete len:350 (+),score=46.98 TRINITY_DN14077_c0_g1_i1:50-1099(+)